MRHNFCGWYFKLESERQTKVGSIRESASCNAQYNFTCGDRTLLD